MTGNRKPVMNGRPYPATLQRRIAFPLMAGNQQQDPVAIGNRPLEPPVYSFPCAIEVVAVKVQYAVRLDPSRPQPAIPAAIERRAVMRCPNLRG